jgi:aliphatic sulfonates family ABC transporter substrate-binding protein
MRRSTEHKSYYVIFLFCFFLSGICITSISAAEQDVIRFAYQDRIGSVIPIIAAKKNFYRNETLKVQSLRFSSGPACAEALFSGAADIGAMGDTTAIIMASRSPRFVIIASHATGEHRHRVMVRKNSQIQSVRDLYGMHIGVKKGTSTYGGLLAALKKNGLSERDIRIIDLSPPIMTDALLAGSLDAFAASEPTPSTAEQKGARELTTLGGLGNQYPILILANRDILKKRKSSVMKILHAMKKASIYVEDHPQESVAIMAKETGLSEATCQKAMEKHVYHLKLDSGIISSLEQTTSFLKRQGIIKDLPDLSTVIDSGLLN